MKEFKNPILWGFVALLGGMIVGGWGWNKFESTIPERTIGSIPIMIIGVAGIIIGLVLFFTQGNRK